MKAIDTNATCSVSREPRAQRYKYNNVHAAHRMQLVERVQRVCACRIEIKKSTNAKVTRQCCMSLTMCSLTPLWIFSKLLKNIKLTTHDLRDTRDNRVKAQAPQPIGLALLTLTCTSVGCCFQQRALGAIASGMLEILINENHAD